MFDLLCSVFVVMFFGKKKINLEFGLTRYSTIILCRVDFEGFETFLKNFSNFFLYSALSPLLGLNSWR